MIFVMVFVILGILAIPYMWLIFGDDHHATAYGASVDAEPAPATPAEAATAPTTVERGDAESSVEPEPPPVVAPSEATPESTAEAAPTEEAPSEPSAAAPAAEQQPEAPSEPAPAAPAAPAEAEKPKPAKEEPPPRVLPTDEEISAWAHGADVASIGTLFEGLLLKRFDAFNTKFRAKEIFAQHWQVISELETPADEVFDGLPEVGNLRSQYRDQELARRRLGAMKVAWRELRGKRPGLWQVPDLMAAIRRIIDKKIEVNFNDLLHGARDLWQGMTLPVGQEQVEILWACIDLVRKGTKK